MKRIAITLFVTFIFVTNLSAQNTTTKEKVGSVGGYQMGRIECSKQNTIFVFKYENQSDVRVNDYEEFTITVENFDSVYNSIINIFKENHKKTIVIPTVSNYVELEFTKVLGKRVRFIQSKRKGALGKSYSAWFSEKEINKLFGKN